MVMSAVAGVTQSVAGCGVSTLRAKQSYKGAAALPRVAPTGTRVVASRRSGMSECSLVHARLNPRPTPPLPQLSPPSCGASPYRLHHHRLIGILLAYANDSPYSPSLGVLYPKCDGKKRKKMQTSSALPCSFPTAVFFSFSSPSTSLSSRVCEARRRHTPHVGDVTHRH